MKVTNTRVQPRSGQHTLVLTDGRRFILDETEHERALVMLASTDGAWEFEVEGAAGYRMVLLPPRAALCVEVS